MAVLLRKMAQTQYTVPAAKGSQGGYAPALSPCGGAGSGLVPVPALPGCLGTGVVISRR
jgi:hypothetical protein